MYSQSKTWLRIPLMLLGCGWLSLFAATPDFVIKPFPDYDQDMFPIDRPYGEEDSESESGDCTSVAATMIHGFYDSYSTPKKWPRLIPYGKAHVTPGITQPYSGNAWGVDTVVRAYKTEFGYRPNEGVTFLRVMRAKSDTSEPQLAAALERVIRKFEPKSEFRASEEIPTKTGDEWEFGWETMKFLLNPPEPAPFLLNIFPWTTEYTLTTPVVMSVADLPTTGRHAVILARVGVEMALHCRIFDQHGTKVKDVPFDELPMEKAALVTELRRAVDPLFVMGRTNPTAEEAKRIGGLLVQILEYDGFSKNGEGVRSPFAAVHSVTVKGWAEQQGGRWLVASMGWGFAEAGWINADGSDEWFVGYVLPGRNPPSPDDDDPVAGATGGIEEDNDTIDMASPIERGIVYGPLRCRDTLIVNGDYAKSYGDWYKVTGVAGKPLGVTIRFRNAEGNLDLRLFDSTRHPVSVSETAGDFEQVGVSSAVDDVYYVFVYGFRGAQNDRYTIEIDKLPLRVGAKLPSYNREYGFEISEFPLEYEPADFLPGHDETDFEKDLAIPPKIVDPGACVNVGTYPLIPAGGSHPVYRFVPKQAQLRVEPRSVALKVRDETRTEGNPNPVFQFDIEGEGLAVPCDAKEDIAAMFATSAEEYSAPGEYEINISSYYWPSPNYRVTLQPGRLKVEPKEESFVWLSETAQATRPRVAVAADGTAHVVFVENPVENPRIVYRRTNLRGEPLTDIIELFASGDSPDITIGPDEQVHVVARSLDRRWFYYARLNANGTVTRRNPSLGPPMIDTVKFELSSPRIVVRGDGTPMVGMIENSQRLATISMNREWQIVYVSGPFGILIPVLDFSSPPLVPSPQAEDRLVYIPLNAEGEQDRQAMRIVRRISRQARDPLAIQHLSMALDARDQVYMAWLENWVGGTRLVWKSESDLASDDPKELEVEAATGSLGPPQIVVRGEEVVVGWAEREEIGLTQVLPEVRPIKLPTSADPRYGVGLIPAGSRWRIVWTDTLGSRLLEARLGFDASGELVSEPITRVGVSTGALPGRASQVLMPALSGRDDLWALVFVGWRTEGQERGHHVAIYTQEPSGAAYALPPGSRLWDDSDYMSGGTDQPVQVRCVEGLLGGRQGDRVAVQGMVADGVTPLLFHFRDINTEAVRVKVEGAGELPGLLESKIRLAGSFDENGDGAWLEAGLLERLSDGSEPIRDLVVKLDGISLDELEDHDAHWLEIEPTQLELQLVLESRSGGSPTWSRVASAPFKIRRPPVMLVHDEGTNSASWGKAYREKLQEWAGKDGVFFVNYGTDLVSGTTLSRRGNYRNYAAGLTELREELSRALAAREEAFRQSWAMTRYDVIGHGQGGVLLRMLCEDHFNNLSAFINENSFGRGRFRRVITVGAPHNGSLLTYYAARLREKLAAAAQNAPWFAGHAQLRAAVDRFQEVMPSQKFDAFRTSPDSISFANENFPTHPAAQFHLVGSMVDQDATLIRALYGGLGLQDENAWNSVFPSDGVVEISSQLSGGAAAYIHPGVSHAIKNFYCAEDTQTTSPELADHVARLLHPEGGVNFGPFTNPTAPPWDERNLLDTVLTTIVREAGEGRFGPELWIHSSWYREGARILVSMSAVEGTHQAPVPVSEARWAIEVYPREAALQITGADMEDSESEDKLSPCEVHQGAFVFPFDSPEGQRVQIVATAMAFDSLGRPMMSPPTVVYDTLTEHIKSLVIAEVPTVLYRGEEYYAKILGLLDDGGVAEFFVEEPERVSWTTSALEGVSVEPTGLVKALRRTDSAKIWVNYRDWGGVLENVEVRDRLPGVVFLRPRPGEAFRSNERVTIEVAATDPEGELLVVKLRLKDPTQPDHALLLGTFPVMNGGVVAEWHPLPPYTWTWTGQKPAKYQLIAEAFDGAGSVSRSSIDIEIESTPPACVWLAPEQDAWVAGDVLLRTLVVDPDPFDAVEVRYEYSLNSSNGVDGDWFPCISSVTSIPGEIRWNSEPRLGVNPQVWLRARATDSFGLASPYILRRIGIDNSVAGGRVVSDPHPGERDVALDRHAFVEFCDRPIRADGSELSDTELADLIVLRDASNQEVPSAKQVLDSGRRVELHPRELLLPRQAYTIEISQSLTVCAVTVPPVSSTFQTTFGAPAGLRVLTRPFMPMAGETWSPPLEVMIVDALGNRVENATAKVGVSLRGAAGTVLESYTSVAAQGVARFHAMQCDVAGVVTLVLSCPDLGLEGTDEIMVRPGPLAGFLLEAPLEIEAGQPLAIVATAVDRFNNVKTDYLGAPVVTSNDPLAVLGSLSGFRTSDQGRRVYSNVGTLGTLGDRWLQIHAGQASSPREAMRVRNAQPATPRTLAPVLLASCGLSPNLEASAFADKDDAAHGASQWQISEHADFKTLVWDSGPDTGVARRTTPDGILSPGASYYWRVRYQDAPANQDMPRWSDWSVPARMRTAQSFPFVDDFSMDRGWRIEPEGLWARTPAEGLASGSPTDDTSEDDERLILTTALNGGPPASLEVAHRIISPAIDCSEESVVQLSFQRWLQVDAGAWAQAEVAVSSDGVNWTPIWRNTGAGTVDSEWKEQRFDITALAAHQPTVYVSFSIGPLVNSDRYPGWHVDDVKLDRGADDLVWATINGPSDTVEAGEIFDVRILVREQVADAHGVLGCSFDLTYNPAGFELISPASASFVVQQPFNQVLTVGDFASGRIMGLGGATLAPGHGDGTDALFALLKFRALRSGTFEMTLSAGAAGCVITAPVGLVNSARVRCGEPLRVEVAAPTVLPTLEIQLTGPVAPVLVGDTFEVVVAVRENHATARGFFGGAVDLYFDESLVAPVTPLSLASIVSSAFQSLGVLSGTIAESRLDELGGVTLTEGHGDGVFVEYLRVPFRARAAGQPRFTVGPSQAGLVAASPVGKVEPQNVSWSAPLQVSISDGLAAPRILTGPLDAAIFAGQDAEFSVSVEGDAPLQYRWHWNGVPLENSPRIHGTDTPILRVSDVQMSDAGAYTVLVENQAGDIVGGPAVLLVLQPNLNIALRAGSALELSWSGCEGCRLESTDSLTSPNWQLVAESIGGQSLTIPIDRTQAYFRLIFEGD